jgi:hypothetical protein
MPDMRARSAPFAAVIFGFFTQIRAGLLMLPICQTPRCFYFRC